MNNDIKQIAKKLKTLNGSGKLAQLLYKEYYERQNVTMTVTNVICSIIEKLTKKEFELSKSFRRLVFSKNECIVIKMDFCVNMITIRNTSNGNFAVLKTDKFSDSLTKFKALMINDIIYHIFDDTLTPEKKEYCFMFD